MEQLLSEIMYALVIVYGKEKATDIFNKLLDLLI